MVETIYISFAHHFVFGLARRVSAFFVYYPLLTASFLFLRFRLNFSHGEHAQKMELLNIIRLLEHKYEHPIAILGDLQGPKLRVGKFAQPDGEILQTGQTFRFDLNESPGTNQRVTLPHPEIIEASETGHVLLVDDGKLKLEVTGTGPGYMDCVVGTLDNSKIYR